MVTGRLLIAWYKRPYVFAVVSFGVVNAALLLLTWGISPLLCFEMGGGRRPWLVCEGKSAVKTVNSKAMKVRWCGKEEDKLKYKFLIKV